MRDSETLAVVLRKNNCLYILILPTQNPVVFNNFSLEKYTFAEISEEEKSGLL